MKWRSATLDPDLDGNDAPALEDKLREANRQLVQAFNQNEKLVNALYEAREQITALKEEVAGRARGTAGDTIAGVRSRRPTIRSADAIAHCITVYFAARSRMGARNRQRGQIFRKFGAAEAVPTELPEFVSCIHFARCLIRNLLPPRAGHAGT